MTKIDFQINSDPMVNYDFDRDDLQHYSYKIISHHHKYIFLEYPKAASSSVKTVLMPELYREYRGKWHYSKYYFKKKIKELLGKKPAIWPFGGMGDEQWRTIIPDAHFTEDLNDKKYDNYFVFSTVRNPYDKMVSAYKHGAWGVVDHHKESFEDFIDSLLPGNQRELTDLLDRGKNHFMPWTTMFDHNKVDFVIRFENLGEDIAYAFNTVGIKASLPKENVSREKNEYQSFYTSRTKEIVTALYKKDLELFDYSF